MFLETAVPEGRNWPQEWDSRQELGAYAATVKALRAQVPGRDGAWFPALDESGGHGAAAARTVLMRLLRLRRAQLMTVEMETTTVVRVRLCRKSGI